MSSAPRPEAVPFAPGSSETPPPLAEALTSPDSGFLLVVAPDQGDMTLRTVIALAEARIRAGQDTVLMDAAFADPRLHQFMDVPNQEGVADIFEFGASLDRVVTEPETRALRFVPAGEYVSDTEQVMSSARWPRLAERAAAADAGLLIFTTAETPGVQALTAMAGGVILLGDEDGVERVAEALGSDTGILAVVEPVAEGMAPHGEEDEAEGRSIFDDPSLTEPVIFRRDQKRRRSPLIWILLVILLAVAGWFAWDTFLAPGATYGPDPVPAQDTAVVSNGPVPDPVAVETPVGYSVAVEAHQDLQTAQSRLARLRADMPAVGFYLAPVAVNESLFYRILAGPVQSRDAGEALMEALVDRGHKTAFDAWAVRPTTLAFRLGEFDTAVEALNRVEALRQQGIPAYVVPIRYDPGDPRHRVYGGAFENPGAASVMEGMLAEAGIEAPLVERVGVPVLVGS